MVTERVKKLRDDLLSMRNEICIERAILITEFWKKEEEKGEHIYIARSKSLEYILSHMPIYIRPGELIVGNIACKPRAAELFPEYSVKWILEEMDTFATREGDRFFISEENKEKLREILPYWCGKSVRDRIFGLPLPECIWDGYGLVISSENMSASGVGHTGLDHKNVLAKGIKGIKEEIREKLKNLDPATPSYIDKVAFYEGLLITCDAIVKFAGRYAEKAKEMAEREKDPKRRTELKKIQEICEWVPKNPARTFHEALQSFWFMQILPQIECNGLAVAPGRFDQYMYPFYKKDLEEERITREEAKELLELLLIKFNEINKLAISTSARFYPGPPMGQAITLGGRAEEINILSYLMLDAREETPFPQPDYAARISLKTPDEFMMRIVEFIKTNPTELKILNDQMVIPSLLSIGYPLEDAEDYHTSGCCQPIIGGKMGGWMNCASFNIPKCLELALNNGVYKKTGKRIGPSTGAPTKFSSFEDVVNAFRKQVEYFVRQMVTLDNGMEIIHARYAPLLSYSLQMPSCIEKGVEYNAGGSKYNPSCPIGVGLATVGDSLAALKKLVFDDKKISMAELKEALDTNFKEVRGEEIRQALLEVPKYGNDNDYVDLLTNRVLEIFADATRKYRNTRGGPYYAGLYSLTANLPFGKVVGATPNGRKARKPLSDSISPDYGKEVNGPTGVANSVGKLNHIKTPAGTLLNMRFNPTVLKTKEGMWKFASFLRAFIETEFWHVQFNMISSEVLREAQKHPEKYSDLLIRVAGYSAFFTGLSEDIQDSVIARMEFQSI